MKKNLKLGTAQLRKKRQSTNRLKFQGVVVQDLLYLAVNRNLVKPKAGPKLLLRLFLLNSNN